MARIVARAEQARSRKPSGAAVTTDAAMSTEGYVEAMAFAHTVRAEVDAAIADVVDGRVRQSVQRLTDLRIRVTVVYPELQAGYEALERVVRVVRGRTA